MRENINKGNSIKVRIFEIAKEIAISGEQPTVSKVRSILKTGSITTIQKYLQAWKINCFKNADPNMRLNTINYNQLCEKHFILEQMLDKQTTKNEYYAQQLIDAEKANIDLKEKIHQLQSFIKKLQFELTETKTAKNTSEQINKEIQSKLDINSSKTIQKMQQTIDDLRLELKTLNENYINALRETSTQGHEALMQEKVNSINLQTKVDNLTKELLDSKKKAYEASMTAQVQNRSLSRQNEQLQKIIENNGLDQLLPAEEVSSLAFTNGAAPHGK